VTPSSPQAQKPLSQLRWLIELKPLDVPLRVALRNSFAIAAPLAIGVATGHTAAGLAISGGALNTMFADQPGPYRQRITQMLLTALAAALAAFLGILVGPHFLPLIVVAFLYGWGGGLLVALGSAATRVGLTSMILLVINADLRLPAAQAPAAAALIFAGGMLQMLMAVAAWPLQRYRPERFAIAEVQRRLADIARQRPDPSQAPPATQEVLYAVTLLHGGHRSRSLVAQSFRIIIELCERTRLELLALGELQARMRNSEAGQAIEAVLLQSAKVLDGLAQAMTDGQDPKQAEEAAKALPALLEDLSRCRETAGDVRDRHLLRIAGARAHSLMGQLRALTRNGYWASSRGEIQAQLHEARLPSALRPRAPLATLRANLTFSSVAFRHALRCGACLAIAVMLERLLAIPHGFWIPMTAAIVLKPDFGGTLSYGVLRVAGTLAGLLLATGIIHLATENVAVQLLLLALLAAAYRLFSQVNYGIGVALLTGMLVIMLSFQSVIPPSMALDARVNATILGSLLALTAYALWPTWEVQHVRASLAKLIEAYRDYMSALLHSHPGQLEDARNSARTARTNAQASIERLRGEPRHKRNLPSLRLAETLVANANRLIRICMSLEAVLQDHDKLPQSPELAAFTEQAEQALTAIATALRDRTAPPSIGLRPYERKLATALFHDPAAENDPVNVALADSCDRIADSVNTLAHILQSVPAGPAAPETPPSPHSAD
jgi:uncharacterized membrane protein YccC